MVETFIVNEIIKSYKNNRKDKETSFYYFRNTKQDEIDLIIVNDGKITLIECKSGEEYKASDVSSFEKLSNTKLQKTNNAIICTTKTIYPISSGVYVIPFTSI